MNKYIKDIVTSTTTLVGAVLLSLLSPKNIYAEQYGQGGVVLGDSTTNIAHATVDAGITEAVLLIGMLFIILSATSFYLYSKLNKLQS